MPEIEIDPIKLENDCLERFRTNFPGHRITLGEPYQFSGTIIARDVISEKFGVIDTIIWKKPVPL